MDGVVVAKSFSDLIDGTLLQPIDVTEFGAAANSFGNTLVYTGTKADGTPVTVDTSAPKPPHGVTCADWTMQNQSVDVAYGNYTATDQKWSYAGVQFCDRALRLYCFEQ